MRLSRHIIPYLFLAPALLLLIVFNLVPTIATLVESTFIMSLRSGHRVFAGFANYERIFNDPIFWKSFQVTVVFSLLVNPIQIALALALAMLINQRLRGIGLFRSIYLLPIAVSLNVTAIVWGLMLDQNSGMINGILTQFGIARQPFLHSVDQALWSIILIASWIGVPLWSLFILAGLQNISPTVLEAAKIDGANAWQSFSKITLALVAARAGFCARRRYRGQFPYVRAHLATDPGRTAPVHQSDHVRDLSAWLHLRRLGRVLRHADGYAADRVRHHRP